MTDDDARASQIWATTSGVEFALALSDGRVPISDVMAHIGLSVRSAQRGMVELGWDPPAHLANRAGIVHGGYLSIVLDDAAGIACGTLGERFTPHLTMNLNIEFIRPVVPGVPHVAIGTVVKEGKTRVISDGHVEDGQGQLVARAHGSFIPNRRFLETAPGFTHTS